MLDIAVAQLNLTVGDLDGNVRQMTTAARRAWEQQANVVVFPELALTGYYPGDLLAAPAFLQRTEAAFHALLLASRQMPGLHWVVGLPVRHAGPGHGLHNALHVIRGGDILLTCAKQLLPTYNVFDERRHFDPGPDAVRLLAIRGVRVGFLICEDGWNDSGQSYVANPFERLRDAAPDLVVSINASPSNIGKRRQRHDVLGQAARRHSLPLLYVNHVGGHDQLVYDGASFAVEADGRVVFEARRFEPELRVLRFAQGRFWLAAALLPVCRLPLLRPPGCPATNPKAMSRPPWPATACRAASSTAARSCWACATTPAAAALPMWWWAARAASTPRSPWPWRWRRWARNMCMPSPCPRSGRQRAR